MNFSHDRILTAVAEKVESGDRLSFEDGLALFATDDLPALGKLADSVRRRKHGRTTFFNVNRHFILILTVIITATKCTHYHIITNCWCVVCIRYLHNNVC